MSGQSDIVRKGQSVLATSPDGSVDDKPRITPFRLSIEVRHHLFALELEERFKTVLETLETGHDPSVR